MKTRIVGNYTNSFQYCYILDGIKTKVLQNKYFMTGLATNR